MSFLERIATERKRRQGSTELAWPVGQDVVHESAFGHQPEFPRETYADYIATSNEVFSAVTLRARQMAGLRLNLYRGRDAERQLTSPDHPAVKLLDYVNPFWTAERLARMDEMSMGLWGETIWALETDAFGIPSEIWWLKASRVVPVPDRDKYLKGFLYQSATGELLDFKPSEIIWFRYPNPRDEFSAMSPLAAARLAADTASAMTRSNEQLHSQGLQLGGVIVPGKDKITFKDGQAEELEALLDKRWSKPKNRNRWAVLRYEAQFLPMNVTPKDAEFVAGLNLTLRQVLNVYGIPSPLMNDMEHATLANVRELERWLWEGALQPDAQLKAAEIREQFLPLFKTTVGAPDFAEYDFTKVAALQESQSEAWGRERQALEVGGLTVNEWRASKGLKPVPWGDVWWAPVNKAAVNSSAGPDQNGDEQEGGAGKLSAKDVRGIVEMIQKGYLGVDKVVTTEELRGLLNQAGAGLEPGDPFAQPAGTSDADTTDEPPADQPADQVDDDSQTDQPDDELAGPLGRSLLAEIEAWRLTEASPNGKAHQ